MEIFGFNGLQVALLSNLVISLLEIECFWTCDGLAKFGHFRGMGRERNQTLKKISCLTFTLAGHSSETLAKNRELNGLFFLMRFSSIRKQFLMPDRTYGLGHSRFVRRTIKVPISHFLFRKGQRSSLVVSKFDFRGRVGVGPVFLRRSYKEL